MTQKQRRAPLVLHVEDHAPAQHLRSELLRRAGCQVSDVSTVQDALAAAAKQRPDVVLCDVKLPDGNGFQICREMRTLQPGVPVILISAVYREDFEKQSGIFGGACDYLVEPVTPKELVAAVRRQIAFWPE